MELKEFRDHQESKEILDLMDRTELTVLLAPLEVLVRLASQDNLVLLELLESLESPGQLEQEEIVDSQVKRETEENLVLLEQEEKQELMEHVDLQVPKEIKEVSEDQVLLVHRETEVNLVYVDHLDPLAPVDKLVVRVTKVPPEKLVSQEQMDRLDPLDSPVVMDVMEIRDTPDQGVKLDVPAHQDIVKAAKLHPLRSTLVNQLILKLHMVVLKILLFLVGISPSSLIKMASAWRKTTLLILMVAVCMMLSLSSVFPTLHPLDTSLASSPQTTSPSLQKHSPMAIKKLPNISSRFWLNTAL